MARLPGVSSAPPTPWRTRSAMSAGAPGRHGTGRRRHGEPGDPDGEQAPAAEPVAERAARRAAARPGPACSRSRPTGAGPPWHGTRGRWSAGRSRPRWRRSTPCPDPSTEAAITHRPRPGPVRQAVPRRAPGSPPADQGRLCAATCPRATTTGSPSVDAGSSTRSPARSTPTSSGRPSRSPHGGRRRSAPPRPVSPPARTDGRRRRRRRPGPCSGADPPPRWSMPGVAHGRVPNRASPVGWQEAGQPAEADQLLVGDAGVDGPRPDVQQQVPALGRDVGDRPQQLVAGEEVLLGRLGVVAEAVVHPPHALPRRASGSRRRSCTRACGSRSGVARGGTRPFVRSGLAGHQRVDQPAAPGRYGPVRGRGDQGIHRSLTTPSGTTR